jgi:hypothetical protein
VAAGPVSKMALQQDMKRHKGKVVENDDKKETIPCLI